MSAYRAIRDVPIRVLGIGGNTRLESKSLILLASALHIAEEAGAVVTLADVRALGLPISDANRPLDAYSPSLTGLLAATRTADAYILCSPTYDGTVNGAVKNALDAVNFLGSDDPPYFASKPVALMALGGAGAANVLTSLQHTTRALNGLAITTVVTASGSAISGGDVIDDLVLRRLRWMTDELLDLAGRLRRGAPVLAGTQ
jgi:NAD(P)H-dependent FMN reductase